MMTQAEEKVRSQLVPLSGMTLVIPNTCIAEVVSYREPEPVDGSPEWLLGLAQWRGLRIPMVSFEAANGQAGGDLSRRARMVVLNGVSGGDDLSFFGIVAQDIPRLMLLDEAGIQAAAEAAGDYPLVLEHAVVGEKDCLVPDLQQLESMIKSQGLVAIA